VTSVVLLSTLRLESFVRKLRIPKVKKLRSLDVTNTKVTAEGVAALKKALPNFEITDKLTRS
jgi:hypothetical protein